jgi:hypothetical protein
MGMPGYFFVEITSELKDEVYTRSIKFLGGRGLTWLAAAHNFSNERDPEIENKLTPEQIKQSDEYQRKYFLKLTRDFAHLDDGKHKIVYDIPSGESEYRYITYDKIKHANY